MVEHRVAPSQLEELLDHLTSHPNLAKVRVRSKEIIEREWSDLAEKLNAHKSGATKSGQRWKRYWIDLKHKVKSRVAARRREVLGTGGSPAEAEDLSETDKKILNIIGEGAVYGDTQYRVPVFDHQNTITIEEINMEGTDAIVQETTVLENEQQDSDLEKPQVIEISDKKTSQKRKRTFNSSPTKRKKIEPEWVIELERRRVEAEETISNAMMIIAEASRTQAEAALIQARATSTQAEAAKLLSKAMQNQTECLIELMQKI